jgi:hypothetical protein
VGRAEGIGRPLLYGTTTRFLEHFGFQSIADLPRPEELPVILRERPDGSEAPVEHGVLDDSLSLTEIPAPSANGGSASEEEPESPTYE